MDVLLDPRFAASARGLFAAELAADSAVYDTAYGLAPVNPAARFVAVKRAPAPVSPGDFIVVGGFPSETAALAALNGGA